MNLEERRESYAECSTKEICIRVYHVISVTKDPTLLDCVQSLTDMKKENVLFFVAQE